LYQMKRFNFFILLLVIAIFSGCEKKIVTDLHKVHWDRDMCERCVMVVSDRKHSAQVINPATGKSYMFDDIGCWILWAQENKIEWESQAIIWITDGNSEEWIDARTAFYDNKNITSMAHGFRAHKYKKDIKDGDEIMLYDEIRKHIIKIGR